VKNNQLYFTKNN